jgi:uncharacterized protein (DUF1778 family)
MRPWPEQYLHLSHMRMHRHAQRNSIMPRMSPSVLSVRVNPAERAMLEAAAQAARMNLSDFIRRKVVEAAERDLLERRQDRIPAEDWEKFEAWVNAEPRQIAALHELAVSRPVWES